METIKINENLFSDETPVATRNNMIQDKIIFPKSLHFGKKGESYFITSKGVEQYYFIPKGETEPIRVKWYFLDSWVSDGAYGSAKYIGLNPTIYGKIGTLAYVGKQWIFTCEGEKYPLNSPESVEMLD